MKRLSWKPIRRGNIYCSSACGRGCTSLEYSQARIAALKLAAKLCSVPTDIKHGPWKIRVWENLGWHWSVSKGAVTVHRNSANSYSAFFNVAGPWGGNTVQDGKTAQSAVRAVLSYVKTHLEPMMKLYTRLSK